MFKRDMPEHYVNMMADLGDYAYVSKLYFVYDGTIYKGIFSSEDGALSAAVEYDNPVIYLSDKDKQESRRVY